MSGYDLNVWFSDTHLTTAQASEIRKHVGTDWVIFAHNPHLDAFLAKLRHRYPDSTPLQAAKNAQWGANDPFLESLDDPKPPPITPAELKELMTGPQSVWNGGISQQGQFASMSVLWEKTGEVVPYLQALAKANHLTVLDENDQLDQPTVTPADEPAIFQLSLTLHIIGKQPALAASITDGHTTLAHQIVATRLQAHMLARSLAKAQNQIGYHLDDPRCLAQAYELVPVATDPHSPNIQDYQMKLRDKP